MSAVGGRRSADEFSWNGRRGIFYSNLFEVVEVGWGSFIRRWRFADLRLLICNLFEVKKTTDNGLRTTGCRYKLTNKQNSSLFTINYSLQKTKFFVRI